MGDGSVSKLSGGGAKVYLQACSKAFVESFANNLAKVGLRPSKPKSVRPKHGACQEVYGTEASSIVFYEWFKGLKLDDIKNKYLLAKDCKLEFIRGFYEAEGGLSMRRNVLGRPYLRMRLSNTNRDLLEMARELIKSVGFHPTKLAFSYQPRIYTGGGIYYFGLSKEEEVLDFIEMVQPVTKLLHEYEWAAEYFALKATMGHVRKPRGRYAIRKGYL